jgi:hypothetical protein
MRETRSYGSVRGALSNERPYRELAKGFVEISVYTDRDAFDQSP